ncbi:retinol-binding protein pinta [Culex quinquefasciatus]|uniref:retinol-binding protein pinta n=1 Tax=Culex quinquefasciatus TaxID=7176 RepID=UPI0018E3876A|nr:retinol-binding protein pinta [Culex quinquefasciatus]
MRQIYVPSLSEEFYASADQLLGETAVKRTESVAEVQRWAEQNNVRMHRDVRIIIYFLRTTKYDLGKTKNKIQKYYTIRSARTEWFQNRDPFLPEMQELLDIGVFLPLRQKDTQNRQVVIIRTAAHSPKYHTQDNVFKLDKMVLDLLLHLDETISVYGIVAIFDMKNVTLGHALQLNPSLIKRTVESWENYPCRPQVLEFVNAPVHVNFVLNVFRSFMSEKMKSRVKISKHEIKMAEFVNLPSDLGGTGESYAELALHWKRKVQEYAAWYAETEQYQKRPA